MAAHERLTVAVVGVGYLGRFHAEKYAASEKAKLVGIVDIDQGRADEIGTKVGAPPLTDYRELFGRVQCVSIAVPTRDHYRVARDFIDAGVDVLVEKPLTADINEARELVAAANRKESSSKSAISSVSTRRSAAWKASLRSPNSSNAIGLRRLLNGVPMSTWCWTS
jgi:NAD-dependent oxidoreductase involved in siderophore biosynthesis